MENSITIGGKIFRVIKSSTLEHDHWCMGEIRGAGLDRMTVAKDELPDDFVRRILAETIRSGRVYALLGGFLIPDDVQDNDWTPDIAKETAGFMRKLTDPADKSIVNMQVVALLIGFFEKGLVTLTTFKASSSESQETNVSESNVSAAASTSAIGASSSAPSQASTRNGIKRFFGGLFGKRYSHSSTN